MGSRLFRGPLGGTGAPRGRPTGVPSPVLSWSSALQTPGWQAGLGRARGGSAVLRDAAPHPLEGAHGGSSPWGFGPHTERVRPSAVRTGTRTRGPRRLGGRASPVCGAGRPGGASSAAGHGLRPRGWRGVRGGEGQAPRPGFLTDFLGSGPVRGVKGGRGERLGRRVSGGDPAAVAMAVRGALGSQRAGLSVSGRARGCGLDGRQAAPGTRPCPSVRKPHSRAAPAPSRAGPKPAPCPRRAGTRPPDSRAGAADRLQVSSRRPGRMVRK